jgi:HlyD family secretion protein
MINDPNDSARPPFASTSSPTPVAAADSTAADPTAADSTAPCPGAPAQGKSRRPPWVILLLFVVVGAAAWGSIAFFSSLLDSQGGVEGRGALTYEVVRSPLQVTIAVDGNVESASNLEVKCRVAGGSTILWIVEDGKIVEEGEEIVKLDTSAIDDKLNAQRITYEKALSTEIQAQEDLEAAKISVKEYDEGTSVQLLQQGESEIRIALENLRSAENQLNYSKRMVRKGFVSSLQREADEFAVERAKLDLAAANTRKRVLVDFTKPKTLKELEAKREAAVAHLRSEQAGLELEKARLLRLQEQLKACVLTAPKKGMVVYANDSRSSRFGSSGQQSPVEEGAMVRESQALVRLPDLSRMQVKVMIHESRVDQMKRGIPARIVIQDQDYTGNVISIANQPQGSSWMSANVKEYEAKISIEGGTTGLRPGMTARVTVLVDSVADALCVPVSAVVEQKNQFFCWVKEGEASSRRPLKLGRTNDKLIEVIDGVKEGDIVLRNPRAMLEEARQEMPFEKLGQDSKFSSSDTAAASTAASATPGPGATPAGASPPRSGPGDAVPAAAAGPGPEGRREGVGEGPGGPGGPEEGGKRGGGKRSFDLMQFDKDGDKKLTREELPERMQGMLDQIDKNGDGALDAAELQEMRKAFSQRRQQGGGPGGPGAPGGEGGGGAPGGGEGRGGRTPDSGGAPGEPR